MARVEHVGFKACIKDILYKPIHNLNIGPTPVPCFSDKLKISSELVDLSLSPQFINPRN